MIERNAMETACIALGSNLGDRRATLASAVEAIRAHASIQIERISSLHETDPVVPPGASVTPASAQQRFLNAAAVVRTSLTAREFLDVLLKIEHDHGRQRDAMLKWGPRTLDLDLLLFGDHVIDEPGLTVPHPHMHRRQFVLDPLREIAGSFVHPVLGRRIESLATDIAAVPPDAQGA